MKAHLIRIDASTVEGLETSLFLSSVDEASVCHIDGNQWVPAIARLPQLRYDFFGGDFSGAITTPSASFSAATDGIADFPGLRFAGARVQLWTGTVGDTWGGYTLRFDGRITAEPSVSAGIAQFDAGPDDAWLDRPLLALYAGIGGAEGPDDLEGQPKPLVLGNCRFVPGVLVDAVDNVWQVSGYGAVQAINRTYDRVVALGGPVANFADYASLVAASIPNGSTATCLALGLVRMGAPADGQVSFDVSGDRAGAGGYVRKPGALIRRIAEIAGGRVDIANLAALDAARPYNLSLVLTEQTTARDVIQQIADSLCAVAGITWTGTLFVQPLGYSTPTITLASDGSALPPIGDVDVQPVGAPFWRLATEAEISWVAHDRADVASEYVLRGLYNVARVYRLDDLVEMANGSTWVYINPTPSSGNVPPEWPITSNAWWLNTSPPTAAIWDEITGEGKDAVDSTIKPGGGVADNQVDTPALIDNAVSESNFSILELFGASVGTDDDNVWRDFAYGGVTLSAVFNNPVGGGDATASFDVTVAGVRTGGDNDRISLRVIRGDNVLCMPAEWSNLLFESGGQQSYSVPFFDPDPPIGTSTYTVQTKNLTGHPAWQRGVIRPLRLSK